MTLYRLFHEPTNRSHGSRPEAMWSVAAECGDEPLFMRHDDRFHDLVLGATGNERLVATVDSLRDATVILGASTVDRSHSMADEPEQ